MAEKRPPLNRVHTRGSEAKRSSELDVGLKLTIDGNEYALRMGDLQPHHVRALRMVTHVAYGPIHPGGLTFETLLERCAASPDIDYISTFVWFARYVAGETELSHDEVATDYAAILADGFDIAEAGAESAEELASPEGRGGPS